MLIAAGYVSADVFDQIDNALTINADHGAVRARVSGTLDLENYSFQQPAPAFIVSNGTDLFQPRLSLFLDAQLGPYVYVFAQSRVDRGFDPSNNHLRMRLDEYAVRITPWRNGSFNLQLGRFATVVGNWVPRHLSWDNPFINAPLPYEYLTGIWDYAPAPAAAVLAFWGNVGARPSTIFPIKRFSLPIIWGPSYATGASVSGKIGRFDYAVELKNASLSSRPQSWAVNGKGWNDPTVSARIGYRPNYSWNLGFSASTGSYLLNTIPQSVFRPGYSLRDYREILFGQDASWQWRNWQVWAEVFETRFQVPSVGNADTTAYYIETRHVFTAHWSAAVRWNQQLFSTLPTGTGGSARWGANVWRIDLAPTYRFTPHTQLKLEYSLQHADVAIGSTNRIFAAQFTVRF